MIEGHQDVAKLLRSRTGDPTGERRGRDHGGWDFRND